jgi:hypothetical protein
MKNLIKIALTMASISMGMFGSPQGQELVQLEKNIYQLMDESLKGNQNKEQRATIAQQIDQNKAKRRALQDELDSLYASLVNQAKPIVKNPAVKTATSRVVKATADAVQLFLTKLKNSVDETQQAQIDELLAQAKTIAAKIAQDPSVLQQPNHGAQVFGRDIVSILEKSRSV